MGKQSIKNHQMQRIMRKTICIFTFLLLSIGSTYGQNIKQLYSTNLDFYVGTWRYTNTATNEEFTVNLRKTVFISSSLDSDLDMISEECIVGAYIYKKNGVVVLDNMDEFMNDISDEDVWIPVYASNANETASAVNPNKLWTTVEDYGILYPSSAHPKSGMGTITIVSEANPKQIHWTLKDFEGARIAGHSPPLGFSIPTDIILTKVE